MDAAAIQTRSPTRPAQHSQNSIRSHHKGGPSRRSNRYLRLMPSAWSRSQSGSNNASPAPSTMAPRPEASSADLKQAVGRLPPFTSLPLVRLGVALALLAVASVSAVPTVVVSEQMHQRARQEEQVRNRLGDVRQVLRQEVVNTDRSSDEHEDTHR